MASKLRWEKHRGVPFLYINGNTDSRSAIAVLGLAKIPYEFLDLRHRKYSGIPKIPSIIWGSYGMLHGLGGVITCAKFINESRENEGFEFYINPEVIKKHKTEPCFGGGAIYKPEPGSVGFRVFELPLLHKQDLERRVSVPCYYTSPYPE